MNLMKKLFKSLQWSPITKALKKHMHMQRSKHLGTKIHPGRKILLLSFVQSKCKMQNNPLERERP